MSNYYPPVGFYFEVRLGGSAGGIDSSFAEASGLDSEREIEEVKEGGENRYTHRLPGRAKSANLVLKRGLMVASSGLFDWCQKALQSDLARPLEPKDIDVALLDAEGSALMSWTFNKAWPAKWSVAALDAEKNAVAVETLEFAYAFMTREQVKRTGLDGLFKPAAGA